MAAIAWKLYVLTLNGTSQAQEELLKEAVTLMLELQAPSCVRAEPDEQGGDMKLATKMLLNPASDWHTRYQALLLWWRVRQGCRPLLNKTWNKVQEYGAWGSYIPVPGLIASHQNSI